MRRIAPYSQQFRFTVTAEYAGWELINFFCERFDFKPRAYWLRLIERGQITVNRLAAAADYCLSQGDVIHTRRDDVQEPDVNDGIRILYDHDGVLVVDKPAPLPVHPVGRFFKNTLTFILNETNPKTRYHTIHRLDTWTTGVLVLATRRDRARFLHEQVEEQAVEKTYGVLAVGDFGDKPFTIEEPVGRINACLPAGRGPRRGFGPCVTQAKPAVTAFRPVARRKGVSLLAARPVTGRTNQIRVHVQAAGGYVLHDPLYGPEPCEAIPFMGLHCRAMRFSLYPDHEPVSFTAPWPDPFLDYFGEKELDRVHDS